MLPFVLFMALIITCSTYKPERQRKWDGLRVTWGRDLNNPKFFVRYPRTEVDAWVEGYRMIGDCDVHGIWRGKRYVKGLNPVETKGVKFEEVEHFTYLGSIVDKGRGVENDIKQRINKIPKGLSNTYPTKEIQPPFVYDGFRYVITAYFTDPSRICTTGRTAEEFDQQGTGTNLYIQNSTVPELSILMPSRLEDTKDTLWIKAKCLPYMGIHHYYDLNVNLDCKKLFPVSLLYNNGELNAFAWVELMDTISYHHERSPKSIFPMFTDPLPTCMNEYNFVNTMHVYLTDNVTLNQC